MATRTLPPSKPRKSVSGAAGPDTANMRPASGHFTRPIAVDAVPETGLDMDIEASEAERAALAQDCGLAAIKEFKARFHVQKRNSGRYRVEGRLTACVTQICVVSLDPFETLVEAGIEVDFAPASQALNLSAGPAAASHGEEPPDPIIDGKIDLGALAAEFLILNLDDYPRKPGVRFEGAEDPGEPPHQNSPFAILRGRS